MNLHWEIKELEDVELEELKRLLREGYIIRDCAEEMGKFKGAIQRHTVWTRYKDLIRTSSKKRPSEASRATITGNGRAVPTQISTMRGARVTTSYTNPLPRSTAKLSRIALATSCWSRASGMALPTTPK